MSAPTITGQHLAINDLTISDKRGTLLVQGFSLVIGKADSLCIIGETGSGKSLVAQAVMGLLPPGLRATGQIAVAGQEPLNATDTSGLRALWQTATTIVPQEPSAALDPLMRIGAQLTNGRTDRYDAVVHALASVDLSPTVVDSYPFSLSGGMAQRVMIAHAQLADASLVIADEPTKGLDSARVQQVVAQLRQLREVGKTLLVITHDIEVARGLGGRVAVMRDGAIVEAGRAENVLQKPSHPYTRAWLDADPRYWQACETCVEADNIVLAAHDLTIGYHATTPLLRDLDLHVRKGEVLAVVGHSGVGKTTLGQVLLGLMQPIQGEVSWAGCDPYRDPAGARRLRRRYQKLHQDPANVFTTHRTIAAQLEDIMQLNPASAAVAEFETTLHRLKLSKNLLRRRVDEVSGGEAQRLALARLLLLDPALIVADEPTSRLDPIVQRETMQLLRDLVTETGLSLLLISHQKEVVRAIADEVLELRGP
jgi:peptide/nickel transport system ATP-binding protein